jgi:hypothetical protein
MASALNILIPPCAFVDALVVAQVPVVGSCLPYPTPAGGPVSVRFPRGPADVAF